MKDSGVKINFMDKVSIHGRMVVNMKDFGKRGRGVVEGGVGIVMVVYMKDCLKTIKGILNQSKKVCLNMMMEANTKDISSKT